MKRLLLAPMLLTLLFGCSPNNTKIVEGEWILRDEIDGLLEKKYFTYYYKFLGCIGDICEYYERPTDYPDDDIINYSTDIIKIYCDTLEYQEIGTLEKNDKVWPKRPLKLNDNYDDFALMICEQNK